MTGAFIVLIPIVSYKVFTKGLPKTILIFVIPVYILLAIGFYELYKASTPKRPDKPDAAS